MLIRNSPDEFLDTRTCTTLTVRRKPLFSVEIASPDGVKVLYGQEANREVDKLQVALIRQDMAWKPSAPLWPLWSGYEVPFEVVKITCDEAPLRVSVADLRPDGTCICKEHA